MCVIIYLDSGVHHYGLTTNGILAKFWSVKYINPTCWLKLMSILLLLVQCFFTPLRLTLHF